MEPERIELGYELGYQGTSPDLFGSATPTSTCRDRTALVAFSLVHRMTCVARY